MTRLPLMPLAILAFAAPARAAVDPGKAEALRDRILAGSDYSFCTHPALPLQQSARELCPLAERVPGCDALAQACTGVLPKPPGWLEWLAHAIDTTLPYVAWSVVAFFILLVVYFGVRVFRGARAEALRAAPPKTSFDVALVPEAPGPQASWPAEVLLARAHEAELRGDGRAALGAYLAAALRALGDRGALEISVDRTHGEYVRACRELACKPGLTLLVDVVDEVHFGGGEATQEIVLHARRRAESIVRVPTPTLPRIALALIVVASLLGSGCNAFDSKDNPAGRDLLTDLLTRQGMTVSPMTSGLADLPMDGAKGPALLVDTSRVLLSAEARAHVVAWVKQGGSLILAGDPLDWPERFDAKPALAAFGTEVLVETRTRTGSRVSMRTDTATIAAPTAIDWPGSDDASHAVAHLADGALYGALRPFGRGQVLGLASGELFTNLGLAVPGNAEATLALLGALRKDELRIVRVEHGGMGAPHDPFMGLIHVGLGFALVHALVFAPLLFAAYGIRQRRPEPDPGPERRAFSEHVRAVGALYGARRASGHALAAYARYAFERLRAALPRGQDVVSFLAARSGRDPVDVASVCARASEASPGEGERGGALRTLVELEALFAAAQTEHPERRRS